MCSSSVGRDSDFLKQLLNCTRMEEVQAAFPTMVPAEKGRRQQSRPPKDHLQVVLEECKAELTALCEQYCAQEGWWPPSSVVYKKAHKATRRKVDHPSARIWDADDLSSGVESDSEVPPMNNRSPRTHHPQWMAYPVSGNFFFQYFCFIFTDTSYNIYPCTCFPF